MNLSPPLNDSMERVRAGLTDAADRMRAMDLRVEAPRGQLLRPLIGWAVLDPTARSTVDDRFWCGLLAIQMVHEASLLHDDLLDEAETRRGRPTVFANRGAAAALVEGDRLLTAAYCVATATGSPAFVELFARAVARTVSGEIAQQKAVGRRLAPEEYRRTIEGKSGELFGAAVAWAGLWAGEEGGAGIRSGQRIGALYQMVDDALDYCPGAGTGKEPLQDYGQQKWTFVLDELGVTGFQSSPDDVVRRLFRADGGAAAVRVENRVERECAEVLASLRPSDGLLAEVVGPWVTRVQDAYSRERAGGEIPASDAPSRAAALVVQRARDVGGPDEWGRYFGRHSRSFRFAARLFPATAMRSIEGVYAFCRFTDDLVDEPGLAPEEGRERVRAWRALAAEAWQGRSTGVPLADRVLGEAASAGVPFHYIDELLLGVESDLGPVRVADDVELRRYTYRVASVVGGWITELFGIHDPALLAHAYELGHAMQMTNILRDVGEDWRRGRVYLPATLLDRHRLTVADVARVAEGEGVPPRWADLCEEWMAQADRSYDTGFAALSALPRFYARPVAVAARVYQGIHEAIRDNHYDNGQLRAFTGRAHKLRLAWRGLRGLRASRKRETPLAGPFHLAPQDG